MNELGCIPEKLSVNILEIVTAGLAKEVEEVNQYPAIIYKETASAILVDLFFSKISIIDINPEVDNI